MCARPRGGLGAREGAGAALCSCTKETQLGSTPTAMVADEEGATALGARSWQNVGLACGRGIAGQMSARSAQ